MVVREVMKVRDRALASTAAETNILKLWHMVPSCDGAEARSVKMVCEASPYFLEVAS
jgi:hypothetical protein